MHTLRNRILFFGSAAAVGIAALGLHQYMLINYIDEKGLLIAGNLPGMLLWVLCIGYAVVLGCLVTTIGGEGSYEDNFPRCLLSGSLMLGAGAALFLAAPDIAASQVDPMIPRTLLTKIMELLPYGAAASMAVLALGRMAGKRVHCIFSGVICIFYMLMLVTNYRHWSADPRFYEYAFPMLAGILLMLCSFHRTSCDGGIIQRKKLLFTGLSASVCCMAALSSGFLPLFFLSGGLWAAGSMCNPAVLPPDPDEDEEVSADGAEVLDELGDVGDHDR